MDWELELATVPVTDVDRAKAFYVEQGGFVLDHDHQVNERLRFVQLTPPGSAFFLFLFLLIFLQNHRRGRLRLRGRGRVRISLS